MDWFLLFRPYHYVFLSIMEGECEEGIRRNMRAHDVYFMGSDLVSLSFYENWLCKLGLILLAWLDWAWWWFSSVSERHLIICGFFLIWWSEVLLTNYVAFKVLLPEEKLSHPTSGSFFEIELILNAWTWTVLVVFNVRLFYTSAIWYRLYKKKCVLESYRVHIVLAWDVWHLLCLLGTNGEDENAIGCSVDANCNSWFE